MPQKTSYRFNLFASLRSKPYGMACLSLAACCLASPAFGYSGNSRWSQTQATGSVVLDRGDGPTVLWSIVPNGHITGRTDPGGSNIVSYYDNLYAVPTAQRTHDLANREWFDVMNRIMEKYNRTSGITLVYLAEVDENGVDVGMDADLRIAGKGLTGAILGSATAPNAGDVHMRTNANHTPSEIAWRMTFAHEVGHALGLGHDGVTDGTSVMDSTGGFHLFGPQLDDIYYQNRLYGDPLDAWVNGGNDTAATATQLGQLNIGQALALGTDADHVEVDEFADDFVGIDGTTDVDYFEFVLTEASTITLSITPQGPTYDSREQGDGLNLSAMSDLNLALLDSDEQLIGNSDSGIIGEGEAISELTLGAGSYYIRVDGDVDENQFYRLDLNAATPVPEPSSIITILGAGYLVMFRRRRGGGRG